jgi:hypothetical protein
MRVFPEIQDLYLRPQGLIKITESITILKQKTCRDGCRDAESRKKLFAKQKASIKGQKQTAPLILQKQNSRLASPKGHSSGRPQIQAAQSQTMPTH